MSITLFEHNKTAYDAAVSMLSETGKAAIIHPTGTGKSFIGFKFAEDNPDKVLCWLAPSDYIFKTQIENLIATGIDEPENIVFITYAKLMNMDESEMIDIQPDLIICDEFHRCGAAMWGQGVQNLLNLYSDAPVLGLSATNIRYLDNQRDMADEMFDGNIASYMTLGEAIVRGILKPPVYVTAIYSYQKEYEKYERRVRNAQAKIVRDAGERYLDALHHALKNAEGLDEIFRKHITDTHGKYIVFCCDKEHMDEMIKNAPKWFSKIDLSPRIYSVYSSDPEASKSFVQFKEDTCNDHLRLLYCIDALNEGIHIHDISGVILFRPTVSPIVFKQQIGRALSAKGTKQPIIFDIVDNIGNLYSIGAIQEEMQSVVNYFRNRGEDENIINETFSIIDEVHDCKRLFEELENTLSASWDLMFSFAEQYFRTNHDLMIPSNYETEDGYKLGQWIVTQRQLHAGSKVGNLTPEQIEKLDSIGMCWQFRIDRLWDEGYASANDFYIRNGHLNVTRKDSSLYSWLLRQRQKHREKALTEEQYQKLSAIHMVWEIDDEWERFYKEAELYYRTFGNLDIPAEYVTESGNRLGRWYRTQRNTYRTGQLTKERQKRLEDIGIQWTSVKTRTWMKYYNAAQIYYAEHGNLHVAADYKTKYGLNLGVWISGARYSYQKGRLPKEQYDLLEKIHMDWQRFESRWEDGFSHCVEYLNEHRNLDFTVEYQSADGFKLGTWLFNQKYKYRTKKLSNEQIGKLESIGIRWESQDAEWSETYTELKKFYEDNGKIDIPGNYMTSSGVALKGWTANQRTKYRTKKLAQWKIEKLNEIGFLWKPTEHKWQTSFENAKKYYQQHQNLNVTQTFVTDDGFALGAWLSSQRARYRKGKLADDRIALLEGIGFLWNPQETAWQEGYEKLKSYLETHEVTDITSETLADGDYKLGEWARTQTRAFNEGRLDKHREQNLLAIGFVFFETNNNRMTRSRT